MKKLGLIVNPIAGMGGRVGLKGSDGEEILRKAKKLGAKPVAPDKALVALKRIAEIKEDVEIITFPGGMGEAEAREAGFEPSVIGSIESGNTTKEDTIEAAKAMVDMDVELILFAGGDGTARDIYEAINGKAIVLGIPAGVKIHSGVFATSPISAGNMAIRFLKEEHVEIRNVEVMDIDEELFRKGVISARLYGYLRVPFERSLIQGSKEGGIYQEELNLDGIAEDIIEEMEPGVIYIIGPGSTTKPIAERLGVEKTLLGVDLILDGEIVAKDVNESNILEHIKGKNAKIIVTVIGGQGFIFGRGNQQLSPQVICKVGKDNIIVVATQTKLASIKDRPLLVDTGDECVDKLLSGYHRVVTGYSQRVVRRIATG